MQKENRFVNIRNGLIICLRTERLISKLYINFAEIVHFTRLFFFLYQRSYTEAQTTRNIFWKIEENIVAFGETVLLLNAYEQDVDNVLCAIRKQNIVVFSADNFTYDL